MKKCSDNQTNYSKSWYETNPNKWILIMSLNHIRSYLCNSNGYSNVHAITKEKACIGGFMYFLIIPFIMCKIVLYKRTNINTATFHYNAGNYICMYFVIRSLSFISHHSSYLPHSKCFETMVIENDCCFAKLYKWITCNYY